MMWFAWLACAPAFALALVVLAIGVMDEIRPRDSYEDERLGI